MPSASKDELMVLAVYMPPHDPVDGQALRSMPSKSSRLILPGLVGADRLEGRDDGQVLALPAAGQDGAAIDEDAGHVGPCQRHHAAGHVLVAAADHQDAVHPLAVDAGLDAVREITSREVREYFIPSVPIAMPSDTVGVPKVCGLAPAALIACLGRVDQRLKARVAWRDRSNGRWRCRSSACRNRPSRSRGRNTSPDWLSVQCLA